MVIAIIALLMAILMPALQRVKEQAGKAACQSNLKQMGLVVSMYTNDFDGKFHQESPAGPHIVGSMQCDLTTATSPRYVTARWCTISTVTLVVGAAHSWGGVYTAKTVTPPRVGRLRATTAAMGGTGGSVTKTASRNIGGILTRSQVTATRSQSSWMLNGWMPYPNPRTSRRAGSSRS
ncbi:MAG: type II secretion system protein [Phycisphaerae bacterium]